MKILKILLICFVLFSGSERDKLNADNIILNPGSHLASQIKEIANKYVSYHSNYRDLKELDSYMTKEIWNPGGEGIKAYIIDDYKITDIITLNNNEYGKMYMAVIEFHGTGSIDTAGYSKINRTLQARLGFVFEDDILKIKSIFSGLFLTPSGAKKWVQRYKNNSIIYDAVMKNIK